MKLCFQRTFYSGSEVTRPIPLLSLACRVTHRRSLFLATETRLTEAETFNFPRRRGERNPCPRIRLRLLIYTVKGGRELVPVYSLSPTLSISPSFRPYDTVRL